MVGSPSACQHHVTAVVFGVTVPERLFSLAIGQNRAAGRKAELYKTCNYKEGKEKGHTKNQVISMQNERIWYRHQNYCQVCSSLPISKTVKPGRRCGDSNSQASFLIKKFQIYI